MKKIPYGKSEFKDIKLGNYYYIDKTQYIPILEMLPDYLFFIRPRRFGKSLFLSMLHYYYDEKYKEQFDKIFKNTWILENKTKEANSYKILRFDFSVVDSRRHIENKEQLDRYESDEQVQQWVQQGRKLKKIVMVFYGWEMVYCGEL